MVGIPGSGKSLFAEKFAATFHAPHVKYDTIMTVAGQNTSMSDMYAGYMLRELFKTGHTIMFDGPTGTKLERNALRDLAATAGYTTLFIWVQTDEATARTRFLKASKEAGQRVNERQYDVLVKDFAPPQPKEHPTVVISGKHTYATQVKAVLKNLTLTKQMVRTQVPPRHETIVPSKRNIMIR
jgi:predicted kinase